ncbi:MAG: hypothetical protein M3Q72_04545 [Actinomycetota bacterium]|nr:hypothetical protein [Actinomycetota bacterium]
MPFAQLPLWPIREVCFVGADLAVAAVRYAVAHPDRLVVLAGARLDIGAPGNVEVRPVDDAAASADFLVVSSPAVLAAFRRRGRTTTLLGAPLDGGVELDDLIDGIIPIQVTEVEGDRDQPSSSDTNSRPSRDQSNWARAAS